ncbi:MAG: thiamine phosphate synthase [Betaproteobacteria bacterium]
MSTPPTPLPNNLAELAAHIAQQHASLQLGEPVPWPSTVLPTDAAGDEHTQAVLSACRRLGFVEHDAQAVAQAWAAQTRRLGTLNPDLWPSEPADFGMAPFPRAQSFPACPQRLGLYAVLPDAGWVGRMARAGVPTLQLRFKSDDPAAVRREVAAAVEAVRGTAALLFINDHWQVAADCGAYGVHLGQEDLDATRLSDLQATGLRLGLSTHGYAEMLRADAASPSYIAMGAVFATTLKRMATAPQGPGRLSAYAALLRNYPRVAIGGIDEARLPEVLASGVGSVAVVRAITAADNPEQAADALMRSIVRSAAV